MFGYRGPEALLVPGVAGKKGKLITGHSNFPEALHNFVAGWHGRFWNPNPPETT